MSNILLLAQAADVNGGAAAGGFFGGLLALGAIFWVVAAAATIFWLWMLIDVLTSTLPANEKILWFLVVFFLHIIGAVIYFVVARKGGRGTVGGTAAT